jgi:hypothetical protein
MTAWAEEELQYAELGDAGKRGMGYLDNAKARGLKVHSVFCSTEGGVPLGVLHQQVWARDIANVGKKHQRLEWSKFVGYS